MDNHFGCNIIKRKKKHCYLHWKIRWTCFNSPMLSMTLSWINANVFTHANTQLCVQCLYWFHFAYQVVLNIGPTKIFSHQIWVIYFFPTSPIKLKLRLQIGGRLIIATHLDQSNYLANQRQVLGFVVHFNNFSNMCKNARPKPFCTWEAPEHRLFPHLRYVPKAGKAREQVKMGFFHFLEIVTSWLVPSAGQMILIQPSWYLPHSRSCLLKTGFFRQVRELQMQRKNPGSALWWVNQHDFTFLHILICQFTCYVSSKLL